ncbi:MAG: 3-oxoacyl-[acyl-carrier-protein] reductase [Thermoanaerobaculia bacterium]|nr:3-oxoacyl-[acyl-carrier-protein] reductase [Thermoanaerobaculia bacterium]
MFRMDDRIALVTGASRGIGREIAKTLAGRGARIVAAARSEDRLAELCGEIETEGGKALPLALDLAAPDEIPERIDSLPEEWSEIGILVNNAGITDDGLLARMTLEQWERVIAVNLTGTFAVTKKVIRGMMRRRWGRIVTVSSVIGMMGNSGQANYAASKAGLIGFSKSLARELGSRNITSNVVAPGFIETDMTEDLPSGSKEALEKEIAVRRLGTTEDVAAAVAYLASEDASYVTGAVLNVSGGLHI